MTARPTSGLVTSIVSLPLSSSLSRRATDWLNQCRGTIDVINSEVDALSLAGRIAVWNHATAFILKAQDILEAHDVHANPKSSWQLDYVEMVDKAAVSALTEEEEHALRQLDLAVRQEVRTQIWVDVMDGYRDMPSVPKPIACPSAEMADGEDPAPCPSVQP